MNKFFRFATQFGIMFGVVVLVLWVMSTVSPAPRTEVCFMPGGNCQQMIIDKIDHAHKTIYVQAYHLTNASIIWALLEAENRGVHVVIIIDKAAVKEAVWFKARIPTYVDYRPTIAHNKVMIFDEVSFVTGSYNFTNAAQTRNAENALWEYKPSDARRYKANFDARLAKSVLIYEYRSPQEKRLRPSLKSKQ